MYLLPQITLKQIQNDNLFKHMPIWVCRLIQYILSGTPPHLLSSQKLRKRGVAIWVQTNETMEELLLCEKLGVTGILCNNIREVKRLIEVYNITL
jgi:hypothetical protein